MSSESQPESLSQRQQSIVDWVRRHGYATIDNGGRIFCFSTNHPKRNHRIESSKNPANIMVVPVYLRDLIIWIIALDKLRMRMKRNVLETSAKEISNESSIFIDIGTTTEAVSKALITHKGLKVIMNHMSVASVLWKYWFRYYINWWLVRNRDSIDRWRYVWIYKKI